MEKRMLSLPRRTRPQEEADASLERVIDYMSVRIDQPFSLPTLCRISGLCGSELEARFARRFGVSPELWLRRRQAEFFDVGPCEPGGPAMREAGADISLNDFSLEKVVRVLRRKRRSSPA